MQTVKRWAFDPETDQDYEIEFPSGEAVQAALLALDYPAHGMSTNDVTDQLAEHFSLTDQQRNVQLSAQIRYGVFPHLVNTEANNLVRSGQLVKPQRGWFAKPEQTREGSELDTAASISAAAAGGNLVEDNFSPTAEESIETDYQQIQDAPETDLLQRIQDNLMQINFVDIDGAEASIDSKLSIPQMLELKHEGVIWYARSGDTICLRAGLSYVQLERMRRAPIWRDHVEEFLIYKGLELSDANFKKYGCMPPERKSRQPKGARGISNPPTQSGLERVRESSRESASEGNSDASGDRIFATVTRTAFDPETDQAYEVEFPSNEAVQAALLALDYPAHGMSSIDAANRLAEYFSLTDRQRNARSSARSHRYGLFLQLANFEANNLVKSGQLVKLRRGWFAKPEQIREGSELDTAASIPAAAGGNPVEDNLSPTAEESIETDYQQIQDALAMETVKRTAFDPETDQAYEVELPSNEAVQAALLALDYPARGMSTKDVVNQLAEHFSLTARQRNARGSAQSNHYKLFRNVVTIAANNLVKSGWLVKPRRGWFAKPEQIREGSESDPAPSIAAVAATDNPVEDNLAQAAEESIETDYQQIQDALAADLLQRIEDNSPDFFEELVIDLLVAMGYGGSREEAGRAVGGSGDGGIDGVINEDILGLDVIYVQAKRWQADVGEPPVRDFVGALQGRRARKGIFITTSAFSNRAKEYVSAIDSRDTKIILIDGHQLAQFMIQHNVGVSVVKSYEIKRVDSDYFAEEGE